MDIKRVVKDHGFTLEQVAQLMPNSRTGEQGVSKQSMSLIVNGNPQVETLRSIAKIIGCNIGEFFDDEQREITSQNTLETTCPHCGQTIKIRVE